jgi:hypothetical protein
MINNNKTLTTMKKELYVSPEACLEAVDAASALLSGSTETLTDSSLEVFEDNGDVISW